MLNLKLPNNDKLEFDSPVTALAAAERIGSSLAKAAVAAKVDGQLVDLSYTIENDAEFAVITASSPEGVEIMRHTGSHILAQAVKRLFPKAILAIGPAIDNGFYYDFEIPGGLSANDLPKIHAEMENIVREDLPIERVDRPKEDAQKILSEQGEKFKVEMIGDVLDDTIRFYRQGPFEDMCRGPHLPSTGRMGAFALTGIAGAYWRGMSSREMLQRVYAVSFPNQKELKAHLAAVEEAKKRDHRKIGKDMDLFSFSDVAPASPFWHPKGTALYNTLLEFWREEHRKDHYLEVRTPLAMNEELWHKSGHWDNYKENMFFIDVDEKRYALKPMNCPGTMPIYKSRLRSYKELPLRYCEPGIVHRYELSGVLQGLFRVRTFVVDDAHIYCTPEQLENEIIGVARLVDRVYAPFNFPAYRIELSTRPEKAIGSDEMWENATNALKNALEKEGREFKINPGDGAFYGPKVDFHVQDCLGRWWQCGTIQVDFSMPERFELDYTGKDGMRHMPVMIHRAIFGSPERFMGIIIEHFAGKFPLWLAPEQVRVLPITDAQNEYSEKVCNQLYDLGIRVEPDFRSEKIGAKIRTAVMEHVPYLVIIGEREAQEGKVSVRHRTLGDQGTADLEALVQTLKKEIAGKDILD